MSDFLPEGYGVVPVPDNRPGLHRPRIVAGSEEARPLLNFNSFQAGASVVLRSTQEGETVEHVLHRSAQEEVGSSGGAWFLVREGDQPPVEVELTALRTPDADPKPVPVVYKGEYVGIAEITMFRDNAQAPGWINQAGITVFPPGQDEHIDEHHQAGIAVDIDEHRQAGRVVDVGGEPYWRARAHIEDRVIGPIGSVSLQ